MENNTSILESILQNTADYGKTNLEIIKLKVLDKSSNIIASCISHSVVIFLASIFFIFLNLGIAFWLGGIIGQIYYGFLVVAVFYLIIAVLLHIFMHEKLKNAVGNYIIKNILK